MLLDVGARGGVVSARPSSAPRFRTSSLVRRKVDGCAGGSVVFRLLDLPRDPVLQGPCMYLAAGVPKMASKILSKVLGTEDDISRKMLLMVDGRERMAHVIRQKS